MIEANASAPWVGGPGAYIRRDDRAIVAALETWLAARHPDRRDLRVSALSRPVGAGMSNETILFRAGWRESGVETGRDLVLRIAPGKYRLFRTPAFESQYRLLALLGEKDLVRVPEMIGYEADPALFGQPFFVMSRLVGRVPVSYPPYNRSGFLHDASPAERRRLWETALLELTRIHRVPDADCAFLARPDLGETGFDQLLAEWVASYEWSGDGRRVPALDAILDWLTGHKPDARIDGLSWGDARIGNMMFGADFGLVGVMDWEQISLGGALQDLAWWLTFDDLHSARVGLKRLDGLGDREETLSIWSERTGRAVTDLRWYEVFANFRLAVLVARKQAIEGGDEPNHNANNNLYTRAVFEWLGLGRPADVIQEPIRAL